MARTALAVSGQGYRRAMAVLADQSHRRDDVHVVPECDVALARFLAYVQREPNRARRRNDVGAVARSAGQRAGRVVVAGGAVIRRPHTRRPMRCANSVTSTAGHALMPGVRERASDERLRCRPRRRAVLKCDETDPGRVWRCQSGARGEYGERRCGDGTCDAVSGAPPRATAHGVGLVALLHLHVRRRLQLRPCGNV